MEIILYRQERKDGGVRMGLQCDGETLLHHFREGSNESDPSLLWYVDVRCAVGDDGPSSPEEARQWLDQWSDVLQDAVKLASNELSAGLDVDFVPWQWNYSQAPDGWQIRVVVSAMRRLAALQVAQKLRMLWEKWAEHVADLQRLVPA